MRQFNFQDAKAGAAITVKVSPGAKTTEVLGLMTDGTIKIRVAAPPEGGAANEMLIGFLAESLGIGKNQIDIMGGLSSEKKLISLIGISPSHVEEKMRALAEAKTQAKAKAKLTARDAKAHPSDPKKTAAKKKK